MTSTEESADLPALLAHEGPAAPPRSNGEIVFHAPWQARLFGITLDLVASQRIDWAEFQHRLIDQVQRHDAEPIGPSSELAGAPEEVERERQNRYWKLWLAAFEHLVDARGLAEAGELGASCEQLAARPHGHDH